MNFLTARTRITIGLIGLIMTLLVTVSSIDGVGPNQILLETKNRVSLAESVAIGCSIHLNSGNTRDIETLLKGIVARNKNVASAGLRRRSGRLEVSTIGHEDQWQPDQAIARETHVVLPLQVGKTNWGSVEILFHPIQQPGILAWLNNEWIKYFILTGALGFFVIYFFLGYVLKQLDPSKAVPRRVRDALNTLAEGLIVTDRHGKASLANDAFAAWVGKKPEKLLNADPKTFEWVFDEATRKANGDLPNQDQTLPWTMAIENGQPQYGWLMKLKTSSGHELTLVANSSPFMGAKGEYVGVLTSFEDITELEEHKVELSKAKVAADEANQAKSEFLARMSHEIRTPMNAILGYTEVLRDGAEHNPENRSKYLATIHNSGEHLLALINDILDLSKVESGKMDLELRTCSTAGILSHVVSVLNIKAREKGIELDYGSDGPVPVTIETDEVRIKQALINLVGNAIKFTDKGGVTITAKTVMKQGQTLLGIDIVDTGIGMSDEQLTKIFQPFAQADTSITRKYGGTGLGLAICKQLVEKMGGTVDVASTLGEGSVFSITIDPGQIDDVPMQVVEKNTVSAAEEAETRVQVCFEDARFLVVDDGDSNRELVGLLLRRSGAVVEFAVNGQEAVDFCQENDYDLVLMDMQMPVKDGFTATRELRELGYEVPIVALTANAMHEDEVKCRASGCNEFLAKPINSERLHEKLALLVPEKTHYKEIAVSVDPFQDQSAFTTGDDLRLEQKVLSEVKSANADVSAELLAPELHSELPMDDDDFRLIVEIFTGRLREKIVEMVKAGESGDYRELASLAHWLKGSGGTAGFNDFTLPSKKLQDAAEDENAEAVYEYLSVLVGLTKRIRLRVSEDVKPYM